MFKKILILLAVVVLGALILVAKQPSDFNVTRSLTINAPASEVFVVINNLHKWESWSPWAKLDPKAKTTFEGAESGAGAVMKWSSSNKEVGEGSLTVIESALDSNVKLRLDMVKPFAGSNAIDFVIKPEGKQTLVTWTMTGQKNFAAKLMSVFSNCEKMVGAKFEEGLENMRKLLEGGAAKTEGEAVAPAESEEAKTTAPSGEAVK